MLLKTVSTIAIFANTTWNIYNFRLNLLRILTENDYRIVVITPVEDYEQYKSYQNEFPSVQHICLKHLVRKSTNVFQDLRLCHELFQIFKQTQPDLILNYTIKPNIYGGIVLPSHREGMPTILAEAAAMCKPIIATDVAGCREIVEHGKNGYLVPKQSVVGLAAAMLKMLQLPEIQLVTMGAAGRRKVVQEAEQSLIAQQILKVVQETIEVASIQTVRLKKIQISTRFENLSTE